ncbi:MAG TPA: ribokinase [Clostridiales bacterium]|nr:ribokinase [Clostridiales bacterium]
MKKIAVIGSLNIDLVSRVPYFLRPGETLQGLSFHTFMGGKGGNQAVAVARLTPGVSMLGMLGDDQNGLAYHKYLEEQGVNNQAVGIAKNSISGTAVIEVDDSTGDNRIIYHPGANLLLNDMHIQTHLLQIMDHDIFLFQLETPIDTVEKTMKVLFEAGKTTILDPAPAVTLSRDFLSYASFITPNETELSILTGLPTDDEDQLYKAGEALLQKGARAIIIKAGKQGAYYIDSNQRFAAKGFTVKAVDTTAAGDSFNAGFATAFSRGEALPQALRYANAVAALSTLKTGAQPAMPTTQQVESFLSSYHEID